MPVTLELPSATLPDGARENLRGVPQRIVVGIVNNMPDRALADTERQFAELLEEAGQEFDIRLRLYALDSVPRSPDTLRAMRGRYRSARALRRTRHDALIVTGAEPSEQRLTDEKFWGELLSVLDIARTRTRSTIFSCLAAHGAVLHWDSIERIALPTKLSGVFRSHLVELHPLMSGLGRAFSTPHSRLNGLDEATLQERGYRILARSDAGADIFVKEGDSLLVFLQGHPEYDAHSLIREFRRDLLRYLRGARETLPEPPLIALSPHLRADIERLMDEARRERLPELIERFPLAALLGPADAPWRGAAQRFYRNWVAIVADRQKRDRADPVDAHTGWQRQASSYEIASRRTL